MLLGVNMDEDDDATTHFIALAVAAARVISGLAKQQDAHADACGAGKGEHRSKEGEKRESNEVDQALRK